MLSQSVLALPLERLGPAPWGPGSMPIEELSASDFVKIEGDKVIQKEITFHPPEVEMKEEQERKFANYLDSELASADNERSDQMAMFARLKRKYRTKFPEFPKDWPIANASQIQVPIIRLSVQTLTSRLYQTVMAAEPLLSVRTKNPKKYQDFVVHYENFLDLYNKEKVDMEDRLDTIVTETIKLGTAVAEVSTKKDTRMVITYDPLANKYTKKKKELYNGPVVHHVPIEDFWIRAGYQDVQTAPWVGKEIRLTWSQIKDMAAQGEFDPKVLEKFYVETESPTEQNAVRAAEAKLERREPQDWQEFRLFELFVRWDVDGDGLDEDMIVYYHKESRTFLRKKFNTFKDGRRPWVVFRYVRVEHRFYGEGMAEMLEHLQEEISTIHNQRLDNATIANLHIILVRKLIKGLSPGDRLWTGKIVKVSDVHDDVGTLRMGEIYPNTVTNENVAHGYARELSGIGEVATGQAQPVGRTTATAQLSLLEELNRRFDKMNRGIRKSIRQIGQYETDLFAEFGTNGLAEEWLGDDGLEMEKVLTELGTFNSQSCYVQVTSTKSTVNKEVEFQSAVAVMNLIVEMGKQFMELADRFSPQHSAVLAHELVQAVKGPWKKVLQYTDTSSVEEATQVLAVLERILPAPEDMGGMAAAQATEIAAARQYGADGTAGGGVEGNGTTPEEASRQRGMEDMLAAARQNNGGRAPVATGRRNRR